VSVVARDELLSVGSERGDRLSLVDTLEDKGAEAASNRCPQSRGGGFPGGPGR
jgi:hypothetical protein